MTVLKEQPGTIQIESKPTILVSVHIFLNKILGLGLKPDNENQMSPNVCHYQNPSYPEISHINERVENLLSSIQKNASKES